MTARAVYQVFDQYQKSRLNFAQTVGDLALRPVNIQYLIDAGALSLLYHLLSDICIQIQNAAAIAVGRIIHHDAKAGCTVLNMGYVPVLLKDIEKKNKHYKKSALFVLRSLCKHSAEHAEAVLNSGGLEAFIICLDDFEPTVKEAAIWAIGYAARHTQALAQRIVDAGAIPLIVLCLQEPELYLKQVATSALNDIAKHSVNLAQNIVDAGALAYLSKSLNNQDEKLKKQILQCLSSIAKHSNELAEFVVEAEVFPNVLLLFAHSCPAIRKNATTLVREIVKHSLELAQLIVNTGGVGALMEVLKFESEESKVPIIMALGYIAGHSDQLALTVLGCEGIAELTKILYTVEDEATQIVAAWTLGQVGKHGPEHSKEVAAANAFPRLLELYMDPNSSEDLKLKCKTTLKQCLQKCLYLSALEPLLYNAPPDILKYILGQYSKVLPNDPQARRLFVTTGGLKRVQEIEAEPGSTLMEYITIVNACFPDEIVRFYSPGYPDTLLDQVEQYSPQVVILLLID
ncbi:sperm-associated antigen 6-like [Agrilus planipennis]|uniref:Sperm-associated antigen 6-like n=1 Tax=Agrilus planipennis TaxID=224129 RepID=A0A1W4XRR4_AGRPL|nr:sperm-associated antigen 6-like [Agrilus planipennis]